MAREDQLERQRILKKAKREAIARLWNISPQKLQDEVDAVLREWGEPPRDKARVSDALRMHYGSWLL